MKSDSRIIYVKVGMTEDVKELLQNYAKWYGVSLSRLLLDSAVDRWILRKTPLPQDLEVLAEQIKLLRKDLDSFLKPKLVEENTKPKRKSRSKRLGVDSGLPQQIALRGQSDTLHIDHLIDRFGGDNTLKARLCQLGGRKGDLFKGSYPHALKVETVTKDLDPEEISWFPQTPDRAYWVKSTADEFIRKIINSN